MKDKRSASDGIEVLINTNLVGWMLAQLSIDKRASPEQASESLKQRKK
jgi:hypothetical protein